LVSASWSEWKTTTYESEDEETLGSVLLNSDTLSSNAATLDIELPSGYKGYRIEFQGRPVTDDVSLLLRTSANGGVTFDAGSTDYSWSNYIVFFDGSEMIEPGTDNEAADIPIQHSIGNGA